MNDMAAAIARHKEVLANGEHLLSGLRMHDVQVGGADLATRVEVYDGRGGELAAACQLPFTIVTPRSG